MKQILSCIALVCLGAVCFAQNTPVAKGDFRNEFDYLLIHTQQERLNELEHQLYQLSRDLQLLEETKTKAEQEIVLREITEMAAFARGSQEFLKRELTRTDLNILERFSFESTLATSEVLLKDLQLYEAKAKAVVVTH